MLSTQIIMYPYPGQDKNTNFEYGYAKIINFCDANNIKIPRIKSTNQHVYGYYSWSSKCIHINISRCRTPVKTPGYSWSYTGYKADLTVAGVIAHETGHYVDNELKLPSRSMRKYIKGEKEVSSYEPNLSEVFAESMKLMILNPDLLRVGRPKRYKFITETCGLQPAIFDDWQTVLQNAHPKLVNAAKKWILAGMPKKQTTLESFIK
jgi:hypothetical protein